MPASLSFDFITDEHFRTSLTSDYQELHSCLEAGSWKAVHVLAGSIVEALLIEYLVMAQGGKAKAPLSMSLDEAIKACLSAKAITLRTAKLCDVVKDYRNLIHPGRVIRLQEEYGEDTARIAVSLVSMIGSEIAAKRKINYGLTAEQIVRKLQIDQGAARLLPQLLEEVNEVERRRLVNGIVWKAFEADTTAPWLDNTFKRALRSCYRQALLSLPEEDQLKAAELFAEMVKKESAEQLALYADVAFACTDLKLLSATDVALIKSHLLERLQSITTGHTSQLFIDVLDGIGAYLTSNGDVYNFLLATLRAALSTRENDDHVSWLIYTEYTILPSDDLKQEYIKTIERRAKRADLPQETVDKCNWLIEMCKLEVPF